MHDRISSHPLWDHIDERLDDWYGNCILSPPTHNAHKDAHNHDCNHEDNQPHTHTHTQAHTTDTKHTHNNVDDDIRDKKIWDSMYKAMKVRIKVILDTDDDIPALDEQHGPAGNMDTPQQQPHNQQALEQTQTQKQKQKQKQKRQLKEQTVILAEAPLYPNKLLRLPQNTYDATNNNSDARSANTSSVIGKSKYASDVPKSLPTNSILIHYTDGLTRVVPSLYHLLLKKTVIRERVGSVQKVEEDIVAKRLAKRFDDDIFDILGGGGTNKSNNKNSAKHSLNTNKSANTHGKTNGQTKMAATSHGSLAKESTTNSAHTIAKNNNRFKNGITQATKADKPKNKPANGLFTEDSHLFDLLGNNDEPDTLIPCSKKVVATKDTSFQETITRHDVRDPCCYPKETEPVHVTCNSNQTPREDAIIEGLSNEVERLRSALKLEEELLQDEKDTLRSVSYLFGYLVT